MDPDRKQIHLVPPEHLLKPRGREEQLPFTKEGLKRSWSSGETIPKHTPPVCVCVFAQLVINAHSKGFPEPKGGATYGALRTGPSGAALGFRSAVCEPRQSGFKTMV